MPNDKVHTDAAKCSICQRYACIEPYTCFMRVQERNLVMNLYVNAKKAGLKPRKGKENVY